jgi:general L-amino acid transport system permease protein
VSERHWVRSEPAPEMAPPAMTTGPLGWIRVNLFDGWWNGVLTVLVGAFLLYTLPPLLDWLFLKALWGPATPEQCRAAEGACWSFLHEKYRQILFGRYPYDEQWRPLIGIFVLCGVALASCNRRLWRRELVLVWLGGLAVFFLLMGGGVLGLSPVRTTLWGGLPLTLLLAFVGMAVAFPLAILLALGRRSDLPLIRALCVGYIELIRGVPLITLLFMASFMLPLFMPTGVTINALLRAQVAIILFAAAYLAEVIRGGLQALPKGQYEAADALGLGYWRTQGLIVLPQALKIAIPPIVNTFIGLFKDTSLVAIVSLTDLLLATRQALGDPEWRQFFLEAYIFISLIYWIFCYFMSKYSQYLERILYTGQTRH